MMKALRPAAVLATAAAIFLAGVVVASAEFGSAGSNNKGPATSGPTLGAAQVAPAAATTTNTDPTAVFPPYPQSQLYFPITPCRILDTRPAFGGPGPITAGTTASFLIRGTTGFPAQGGTAGGCGIPESATAITASVSVDNMAGVGYFRAGPYGQNPLAGTLTHYQPGPVTTTGANMTLGPFGAPDDISVKAYSASSSLIIDVTGYYEPQTHFIVLSDGQVWYGNSTHMTELIHSAGTGTYTMIFDRSLTGCDVLTTDNGDQTVRAVPGWGGTAVTVNTYQLVNGSFVHGDQDFQIFIAC